MPWSSAKGRLPGFDCPLVIRLSLAPNDEYRAVGVAKDRQAVRTHELSHPAGIPAVDNDQLDRADALLEISRHTQSRRRDLNLDVGETPQQAVQAPVEPVPAAFEKRPTPDA